MAPSLKAVKSAVVAKNARSVKKCAQMKKVSDKHWKRETKAFEKEKKRGMKKMYKANKTECKRKQINLGQSRSKLLEDLKK
jgi:hypothetical protein